MICSLRSECLPGRSERQLLEPFQRPLNGALVEFAHAGESHEPPVPHSPAVPFLRDERAAVERRERVTPGVPRERLPRDDPPGQEFRHPVSHPLVHFAVPSHSEPGAEEEAFWRARQGAADAVRAVDLRVVARIRDEVEQRAWGGIDLARGGSVVGGHGPIVAGASHVRTRSSTSCLLRPAPVAWCERNNSNPAVRSRGVKSKRVAVVASIAAVLAAGCSDSGQEAEADGSQAHTPAGYHHVAVEAASVTFAAPEGWLDLAPEELDDHAASALVTLAEAAGVSEGELHNNAQELDLFIVEPAPADPSAPESISVTHEPGEVVGGLPTEQEVGALFESVGADIRGFETVAAPAGEVVYGVSE